MTALKEPMLAAAAAGRSKIRVGRIAWIAIAVAGFAPLAGCGNLLSDDCSVSRQAAAPGGGLACASAKAERTVLFSGDDYPRLWTGEAARSAPNVDASALNRPPARTDSDASPAVGFFGTVRVDYPSDPHVAAADIAHIRDAGATNFDPAAKISVNFSHASLDFVLKQLLGGALGVNYIAPDNLGGSITFHTENPLPKSQVLEVVRDILGRNGLAMVYLNGVYEIASGESLKQIQGADQIGDEKAARVVRVRKGSALDVVGLARELSTPDVSMRPTNGNDAVLVRASAANIDVAADLVSSLVADGVGEDKMAIIHVHQAPPELIAAQVQAFYQGRLGKGQDLTIVPLGAQQALLVGTHDERLLDGLRVLVDQLDRITKPEASLRIIQLTYLTAAEVAPQLTAIYGGQGSSANLGALAPELSHSTGEAANSGASPFGSIASGPQTSPPGAAGPSAAGGSLGAGGLGALPGAGFGAGLGANAGSLASGSGSRPPQASAGGPSGLIPAGGEPGPGGRSKAGGAGRGGGDAVKFIADVRNNAIMVYSSYELFQHVKEVLKTIDVPQAQVVIEATIADVTLNDQLQYGVQWFLSGHGLALRSSQSTSQSDPGTAGGFASIGASVGGVSANVLLNALQSITTVKVISSPYLTVVDGKEARLVIGDQIPYTTTTQTSSSNGTSTITNAITTLETGVILDVTPKVLSNNTVSLTIDQEVTQPEPGTSSGNNDPTIDTRSVKSEVLAQSGRTIVLGGMIQESTNRTQSGTPVVQALPLIGNLFKTKSDTGQRTELLVMITPRVVRQSAQLENITRLLRDQLHVN